MQKVIVIVCSLFFLTFGCRNSKIRDLDASFPLSPVSTPSFVQVIPQPLQTMLFEGEFDVNNNVRIICNKELNDHVSLFNKRLSEVKGITFAIQPRGGETGNIALKITPDLTEKEGYRLSVKPSGILIEASYAEGIFYGLQTLQQMIIHSDDSKIPYCIITDAPRFAWRGVMLDVSRTFFPINLIKRYIDLFAEFKINVLHLHLTDDAGWRIEIKQYPKLTQAGSKFAARFNDMGGYYTQDEMRDLIRYASLRNITIVPEIDMPGHVSAAIVAYPELSCTGEVTEIHPHLEGPFVLHEDILCAGRETTYRFIFNVLDEIMDLFPSTYIHIGGDEVPKTYWKNCAHCQQAMVANGLENEEELQSYFVNRVGTYLREHGRTLIGWDEILDGGKLTGDEVLMYWRTANMDAVKGAIQSGFNVICTPRSHCYFDYSYDEVHRLSRFPISTLTVFDYEPVIDGTSEANYLGIQANFWSHIDRSEYNIDRQLFPRLLGLAETAWSLPHKKDWERFQSVARKSSDRLKTVDDVNVYPDTSILQKN